MADKDYCSQGKRIPYDILNNLSSVDLFYEEKGKKKTSSKKILGVYQPWRASFSAFVEIFESLQAPVPGKPISANRGLNPSNPWIKLILRLVSVPESTISDIQGIN